MEWMRIWWEFRNDVRLVIGYRAFLACSGPPCGGQPEDCYRIERRIRQLCADVRSVGTGSLHLSGQLSLAHLGEHRDACQGDNAIFLLEDGEQLKHLKSSVCLRPDIQRALYGRRALDVDVARGTIEGDVRPIRLV